MRRNRLRQNGGLVQVERAPRKPSRAARAASRALGAGAGLALLVSTAFVAVTYIESVRVAPGNKATVAAMKEKSETDASIAPVLRQELDRQREESIGRWKVYDRGGIGILVSAAAFIAWARWLLSRSALSRSALSRSALSRSALSRSAPYLSTPVYLWSTLIGLGLLWIFPIFASSMARQGKYGEGVVLYIFIGISITLYIAVVLLDLFYRLWNVIPPDVARMTPGKAIGFLLIPLFNFYWIFQVVWGWVQDFGRFLSREGIEVRRPSGGIALLICCWILINMVASVIAAPAGIPLLLIIGAPILVLVPILVFQACTAVNALPAAVLQSARARLLSRSVPYIATPFYFGSMLIGRVLAWIFLILASSMAMQGKDNVGTILFSIAIHLYNGVVFLVLFYRLWNVIPPDVARMTPGKATGFLLIPLFNFYWIFQVVRGWVQDFGRFLTREGIEVRRPSGGIAFVLCWFVLISTVASGIAVLAGAPELSIVIDALELILVLIFVFQACTAVNALPAEVLHSARARLPAGSP